MSHGALEPHCYTVFMRSLAAILLGMLLALVIGVIVLLGIVAPLFSAFMGLEGARMTPLVGLVVAVAVGMAFYFGGMIAGYRAPSRSRLHGVAVPVTSFAVSLAVNLSTLNFFETEQDPIANLRSGWGILLTIALFLVSVAAAYLGARRGEGVYAHNLEVSRKREARERAKAARAAAERDASEGADSEG
ncbi:hypothetical protein BH20ACT11_BH20ACT11_01850 [soil metagenome]